MHQILFQILRFYPLPSSEGRLETAFADEDVNPVSIHSPRARGDRSKNCKHCAKTVSIHSPRARGDKHGNAIIWGSSGFLSTPLERGETLILDAVFR